MRKGNRPRLSQLYGERRAAAPPHSLRRNVREERDIEACGLPARLRAPVRGLQSLTTHYKESAAAQFFGVWAIALRRRGQRAQKKAACNQLSYKDKKENIENRHI